MEEHPENISEDPAEPPDLSPRQSVGHRLLLDAAEARSIIRDQVRELLWLLNAPPNVDDIAPVLKNLAAILKSAEEQWPGILDLQALEWLPKLIEQLEEVVDSPSALDPSVEHGPRDWLKRNALYCALRTNPSVPSDCLKRYRLLQAHFFLAHTAWLLRNAQNPSTPTGLTAYESYGEMRTWSALQIDPYHAGLCIRDLAEADYRSWAREFLEKLPVWETPRRLPEHASVEMKIEVQKDERGNTKFLVQKKVNYVSDYLRQVYGIKDRTEGRGGGVRMSLGGRSEIGDPEDPSLNFGILSDWDKGRVFFPNVPPLTLTPPALIPPEASSTQPDTEQASPETSDQDDEDSEEDKKVPSDDYEDEEENESFGGSLDPEDPEFERSPGSFSGRAFGAVNQIIRQQKMFPFAIERLSGWELYPLSSNHGPIVIRDLWKHVRQREPLHKSRIWPWGDSGLTPRQEIGALAFLMVMLWTGSNPRRTASLVVATSENLLGGANFALLTHTRPGTVRIRVPFPKYKTDQTPRPEDQCECSEYISLPDYANLSLVFKTYSAMQRIDSPLFKPFADESASYVDCIRILLKSWDPTGRLTLNKITSTLSGRVMSESGNDAVAAAMITGTKSRLSNVAMHYACRELSFLQGIYQKSVVNFMDEAEGDWRYPHGYYSVRPGPSPLPTNGRKYEGRSPETRFVAKRLCPQDETFRRAFSRLIQDLKHKPHRSSTDRWLKYHNLYTFYTVWVFALATGVRKIRTPFFPVSEISPINGVAKLRDKDGDSGIKTKLVWVPEVVAEQMRYYADHLKGIRERFGVADAGLPCFFLTERRRTCLVRPKTLFPWVSEYLPGYPVDIHRRFMFNALLEFGCPPEIVRIWMGHAVTGEEWWRDDATFSHQNYRQQLRQHLIPILEYLEIKPVKGFAVPRPDEQVEHAHA